MHNDKPADGARGVARRDFLAGCAAATLVAGAGLSCGDDDQPVVAGDVGARVADVKDAAAVSSKGALDAARVQAMLEAALKDLTRQDDLGRAWQVLLPDFAPSMRIGIKVNCISYSVHSSSELLRALVQTMTRDLGAAADRITVWDRTSWDLAMGQLTDKGLGVKVQGTISSPEGPGYEKTAKQVGAGSTTISRIASELTDVTINCAVLKDHDTGGITGAMKNIYGGIHNPGSFHQGFNDALPALYGLDSFAKRTRLCINEGLLAVANGGPMGAATHMPGRLLVAADPVAIDAHALTLINGLRSKPVDSKRLGWLAKSTAQGLGSDKPKVVARTI